MKKIFAFVLASLMVLSLVPASAFAITKCEAEHTTANCDYTLIKVIPATCDTPGYTEYVCNDCGTQFVDDLKPVVGHKWVSNPDKADGDIAANCVYQTNGKQYLICSVCDEEYTEDGNDYKTISYNSTSVHNLVHVSGVGCEKLYACTLCGAEGYISKKLLVSEVAHDWVFDNVETEPGYAKKKYNQGLAAFTCKDCGAVKKVPIESIKGGCKNIVHQITSSDPETAKAALAAATVSQKAVAATCTADGKRLIIQCPDCGYYWRCTNNNCTTEHTDGLHTWKGKSSSFSSSDKKIGKFGHISSADWKYGAVKNGLFVSTLSDATAKAAENSLKNTCGDTYFCTRCSTYQRVGHDTYTSEKIYMGLTEPNCLTAANYYQQCKDCGSIVTGTVKATGHSNDGDGDILTVAATCVSPALQYVVCTNANCPLPKTLVNGKPESVMSGPTTIGEINKNGHKLTSTEYSVDQINKDLYCGGLKYVYSFCVYGCAEYGSGKTEVTQPVLHDLYAYTTAHSVKAQEGQAAYASYVKYACKKCDYKATTEVAVPDTGVSYAFDTIEDALEYFGFITREWAYVDGEVVFVKANIRPTYAANLTIDAIIAKYFQSLSYGFTQSATCTTAASSAYLVKFDDATSQYFTIQGKTIPHTPGKVVAGKPATCNTPGTHTTYVCRDCNITYWVDSQGKQHTTSAVMNPCANPATLEFVSNSCGDAKEGYWRCTLCGTCYTDATCATKYVPTSHTFVTLLAGTAATCNTAGIPEIRYCSKCNKLEVNVIYTVAGKEVRANFNEATNVLYKKAPYSVTIGTKFLSEPVTVQIALDGSITYLYHSTAADAPAGGEVWTTWPDLVTVKKSDIDSNSDGKTDYHAYLTVNGKVASGIVDANAVVWTNSQIASPFSYSEDFVESDHSKPQITLTYCAACDYEFITNYVPATGSHINADYEEIDVNGCNEDGFCIVCNKQFGEHYFVPTENAQSWNCTNAGYNVEACTICGEFKVSGYQKADATKYHNNIKNKVTNNSWDAYKYQHGTEADYANNGDVYYACDVCDKVIVPSTKTPCPGKGLEINLELDHSKYMVNSLIQVAISLDSLKGVNAWGLNFSVGYNPELVEFVSADFSKSPFATNKANAVSGPSFVWVPDDTSLAGGAYVAGKNVPYGIVTVVSNSAKGVELIGDNEYAVLTFKLIKATGAVSFETGVVVPLMAGSNMWHPAYKEYSTNVVGVNGTTIKANYGVATPANNKVYQASTDAFLNLDGSEDGELTIFDAFELYYLIENDEYTVLADADHDGDVDTDDLDILYSLIIGEKTVEDILKGEKEEEKDRVIEYDENGFVIYDSKYDINNDGVLSAYEIAVMTGKIDADLNSSTN